MTFKPGYDPNEARQMMTLSAIAYASASEPRNVQAAITTLLSSYASNFELVWLGLSTNPTGNLVYVVRDKMITATPTFVVVARGTVKTSEPNWKEDFDVLTTRPWPTAIPPNPAMKVATGTSIALGAVQGMSSQLGRPTSLQGFLGYSAASAAGDIDVFVTGHSLGATMATVVGLWLADTTSAWMLGYSASFKTYTFAASTCGNQAFATYYNGQTARLGGRWQAYRVHNEQDALPYAYGDLASIPGNGVPVTPRLASELKFFTDGINEDLASHGVSYVQVGSIADGTARGINNVPPVVVPPPPPPAQPAKPCDDPADTIAQYSCWVGYEHSHRTYLALLKAAQVPLTSESEAAVVIFMAQLLASGVPAAAAGAVIPVPPLPGRQPEAV